uniref:(northern house mosquito) hypothetical protein n=1 Tax=Culex pipiens TaxID=7175 RepID=A0A8D8GT55_CULPI
MVSEHLHGTAALSHDDWSDRIDSVYPNTRTVHGRRRSLAWNHHFNHDLRHRSGNVHPSHVGLSVADRAGWYDLFPSTNSGDPQSASMEVSKQGRYSGPRPRSQNGTVGSTDA